MTSTTYRVTGMTCSHCASAVTDEVTKVPGVVEVDVDLASGAVEITSDGQVDEARVQDAVAEAGYTLAST
ncbi:MAG: heavy-metal-associated domain-containing protein [Actinomycetes bacterium]